MIGIPALQDPDYRRLWVGAACNQQGMIGEHVVLGLLVYRLTGSTVWVGVMLAVYFTPLFVFGMLSGAVADWIDRRALLRRIEFAIVCNQTGYAALLWFGFDQVWLIVAFTLLTGSLRALHQPVRASYAYDIVGGDQVVAGLGLLNLGSRCGQLVGALLAGWIMQRWGAPTALLGLAAGHTIGLGCFLRLRSPGQAAVQEHAPIIQNVREYAAELRRNGTLMMLVFVTATVEIFGFSFSTALPELATGRLGIGAEGLGFLQAARASGGIVAGLVMTFMVRLQRPGLAYLGVILGFGTSLLLLSADSPAAATVAAVVFVAIMATVSDILTQSMMQLSVPNALRGRAMGVWVLAVGFAPVGHLLMGTMALWLGLAGALAVNGTVLLAVGLLLAVAAPRLRGL